jgi:hypothetical protein
MIGKKVKKGIIMCIIMMLCGCARGESTLLVDREDISVVISQDQGTIKEELDTEEKEVSKEKDIPVKRVWPMSGMPTIENFLITAILPVGKTMYVWGGGWNEEDTGAGIPAMSIGVSARWEEFAGQQKENYRFEETKYQINDGLDCSGYIGWLVYNVFEKENSTDSADGYVFSSTEMAEKFAAMGWGECLPDDDKSWQPGDICSMPGHVWLSLGTCEDGSVLLVHSSPPGVRLCGTRLPNGEKSDAIRLAEQYMQEHYPEWYAKYPACDVSYNYLTKSKVFRWNEETVTDQENVARMSPREVMEKILP